MKKFVAGVVIGATLMSGVVYAGSKVEGSLQSIKYFINGVPTQHTGFIHEGTTYVPVRFVAEKLGQDVIWDGKTQTITINAKGEATVLKQNVISYENGTYRGAYVDGGIQQVGVEFKVEDNIVKSIKLSHLEYKTVNYLKSEDAKVVGLKEQYFKLADHLVGKDIRFALVDLYQPGNIVTENVDTFTGATLRGAKVISAIRDGLNRGVYKY